MSNKTRNSKLFQNKIHQPISDSNRIYVYLKGRKIRALLDTGSCATCISSDLVKTLKISIESLQPGSINSYFTANNTPLNVLGTAELDINLQGLIIPFTAVVMDNLSDRLIIGSNFLESTNAVIDYQNAIVSFEDDIVQIPIMSTAQKGNFVKLIKTTIIPSMCEAEVQVCVSKKFTNKDVVIEPRFTNGTENYAVARILQHPKRTTTMCRILNFTDKPLVLTRRQNIATVTAVDVNKELQKLNDIDDKSLNEKRNQNSAKLTSEQKSKFIEEYGFKINPELSTEQHDEIVELLYSYKEIFPRNLSELKVHKGYEADAEILDKRPFMLRSYKLPRDHQVEVEKQVNELLDAGLMESAEQSPYSIPYYCIRKKGSDKLRLILDLRRSNAVCETKLFPLPTIDSIVQEIAGSDNKWFSGSDCYSGFYQIPLKESLRNLTTIQTPITNKRVRYAVAPFGFQVSIQSFLLVLNRVLRKHLHRGIACYVDDLSIYSVSYNEHIRLLTELFELFRVNNLSLNSKKTSLAFNHIDILGYRISSAGIQIKTTKTKAIIESKQPTTVKQIRRFLGAINYFRSFIPRVAQRSYNLRQLLRKNVPFEMTQACIDEWNDLKQALISPDVLMPIKENEPFYLFTDASRNGFGHCYMQLDKTGKLRPIQYGSFAARDNQMAYSAATSELYALFLALKSMQNIVINSDIYVFTDSVTVKMIQSLQIQNNRDKRMHSYFSNFRLYIQHISGEKNRLADYLSRIPEGMTNAQKVEWQMVDDDDLILRIYQTNGCEQETQTEMSEPTNSMHAHIEPVDQINDQFKSQACMENNSTENIQDSVNVASENQQKQPVSVKQYNREFTAYVFGEINRSEQDIVAAIYSALDQPSAKTDNQLLSERSKAAAAQRKNSKQKIALAPSDRSKGTVATECVAANNSETPDATSAEAIASYNCTQARVTTNELHNEKLLESHEHTQQKQQAHARADTTEPDRTGDILQQADKINEITAKICTCTDIQSIKQWTNTQQQKLIGSAVY